MYFRVFGVEKSLKRHNVSEIKRENTIELRDGALECLKWIALILMTGDHISTFLTNGSIEYLNNAGRVVFPIFAFVFAYNLNRFNAELIYTRTAKRLFYFGVVATPIYYFCWGGSVGQLNILFTLLAGLICITSYNNEKYLQGLLLFVFSGFIVEYNWFGLALIFSCYIFVKSGTDNSLYAMLICLSMLYFVNSNFYAFLSVFIVIAFSGKNFAFPRYKWAFYVYYPGHLAVLLFLKLL